MYNLQVGFMNMKPFLVLLMLSGIMYAALWTSGDAGEAWSKEKAEEMCAREDVAAVYICLGNTVSVIWKDESKGTTFYEPEGNVVNCPPVAPTDMGAECMQLMMPNYCRVDDNVCGYLAPEEFPGGETEGELVYDGVPAEEEEPEEEVTPPVEEEEEPETPARPTGVTVEVGNGGETAPATTEMGDTFDSLIYVVGGLAVLVLILLYFVYRKTTGS
jgi:hypothetical protein